MANYLQNLLGDKEKIEYIAHQHWALLIRNILPELALTILGIVLITQIVTLTGVVETAIGYLLLLIPFGMVVRDYAIWENHRYVVTSHRVIQMFGVFNKNVTDSSLEKVNDVKLEQSFWGRLFGYGDIEILTASEMGINRFARIGNPVKFKQAMLNAKQKLETVDGDSPRRSAASTANLLANLEALKKAGVISDAEYEQKKAALAGK
jgi:uncharacterized membrane protein YdbT with pleckstrin-like domain